MSPRSLPAGFIPPCLPTKAPRPPSGDAWLHEIKHDGYRLMARRDPVGIWLLPRRSNDRSNALPAGRGSVKHLKVRPCLIDGRGGLLRTDGVPVLRSSAAGRDDHHV